MAATHKKLQPLLHYQQYTFPPTPKIFLTLFVFNIKFHYFCNAYIYILMPYTITVMNVGRFYISRLKTLYVIATLFLSTSASAQNALRQEIDSLRTSFIEYRDSTVADFEAHKKQALDEYMAYLEQASADHKVWLYSVKQKWGEEDGTPDESTETTWVEYSPDNNNRSIVDFDKGEVMVEVVIPDDGNEAEVDKNLSAAVERILNSRGSTCPYASSVDKSEPLTVNPVLYGLIDFSEYDIDEPTEEEMKPVAPPRPTVKGKNLDLDKNRPARPSLKPKKGQGETMARKRLEGREQIVKRNVKIAKTIAKKSKKTYKKITGNDGKSRKVVQVKMVMVSDNISKNAALYKDFVAEFSNKFNIEQPLIFAVMEQESRFNPEAVSPANAYGLMQLVATTGGVDAYRYVYKKEWIPTRSYLFNPRNNIELGTAYLRILSNWFANVEDADCRRLCVIAGYNTGAGNVSRAFTGKTNVNTAVPHINSHNYNSLYNHLTNNLSTDEARKYVSGVSKRREKYIK